jgi:glycosyltransferase involved in cell wall biosynthesis
MRVLFGTLRGHVPEQLGGSQQDMHAQLQALLARGHTCEAVATIKPGFRLPLFRGLRCVSGRRILAWNDGLNGYPTYRTWQGLVPTVVRKRLDLNRPDLVVADFQEQNPIIDESLRRGIPTLSRIVTVLGTVERQVEIARDVLLRTFSNSEFVASRVRARYGIESPVIYPPIPLERYRTPRPDPAFITFFNPVPLKGIDLVLDIAARLRHRRFQIVEVKLMRGAALADLRTRLAPLPHVTFRRRAVDVRPAYASTVLLLAPSNHPEAFGRVVVEAQASGIPCVARDVGGLGEAVGAGGVLMPASATAAEWAEAVEAVLSDETRLAQLSAAATANAARPELSLKHNMDKFIALAESHAGVATRARDVS